MKVPVSWLKDFVSLDDLSIEQIARALTFAGLEVEEIRYVGWPMQEPIREFKVSGLSWDREKIVVAEIREVMPHPNADRLVLCDLYDGQQQHTVLTGAPNLFPYKGTGRLPQPIKVAYAKEGAVLYDGHAEGQKLTTLKRTRIRGVESYSMVCSEKELGISDDHEGIIVLDEDAPVGMPLADYMGDVVLEVSILPNMARALSILGIARELAAIFDRPLRLPDLRLPSPYAEGRLADQVEIEITSPELNPRFVLGLICDVQIRPSPYWVQRRLKLAGMRPINNIVDATNYAMLELGEPLHAFDYDVLRARAAGGKVHILTRTARPGERLRTLDGVERVLQPGNVLVCDAQGPLSIAGVMGGAESEVTEKTRNVLLEGAAWNAINIRRTMLMHNLPSEAAYRFSRGVHPALAEEGVRRGLQWMAAWSGGQVFGDLVDAYPLPPRHAPIEITPSQVERLLGFSLRRDELRALLERLQFTCEAFGEDGLRVHVPPHRLDIGEGIVGVADLCEEIARLYGYERIPTTRLSDTLPPQIGNPAYEWEESLRDLLANLGLQEVITYRLTSPEREARLSGAQDESQYIRLVNPIAPDRRVLRRNLLVSVLEVAERNVRHRSRIALFEIGPIFLPRPNDLPLEQPWLAIVMGGDRWLPSWDGGATAKMDFFDLKGVLESLLERLGCDPGSVNGVEWKVESEVPYLHPGKAARLEVEGERLGYAGELHPLVRERFDWPAQVPLLVAELNLEVLRQRSRLRAARPVPEYPPVREDLAVIVPEEMPAAQVEHLIREAGGRSLTEIQLFDVYRGEQLGPGRKSLAYHLTYQAYDHTLTDAEVAPIRNRIIRRLESQPGVQVRRTG
jgi:phenylalanyl-tRNA synthetase beta chain